MAQLTKQNFISFRSYDVVCKSAHRDGPTENEPINEKKDSIPLNGDSDNKKPVPTGFKGFGEEPKPKVNFAAFKLVTKLLKELKQNKLGLFITILPRNFYDYSHMDDKTAEISQQILEAIMELLKLKGQIIITTSTGRIKDKSLPKGKTEHGFVEVIKDGESEIWKLTFTRYVSYKDEIVPYNIILNRELTEPNANNDEKT